MKNILYLLFLLLSGCNAQTGKEDAQPVTQQPPFFNDIQHFSMNIDKGRLWLR